MCAKSVSTFRGTSSSFIYDFQWDVLEEELKHTAPVLWTILNAAGTSLGTTYVRKHASASGSPACVMAAGILLNQRNSVVLAAFTASQNLTSLDCDIAGIIKKCMLGSTQGKLDCISQLALQVVKCTSLSKAASGTGQRIVRLWKFLLLFFKQAGKTKYGVEAARLISGVHITLPERQAYELVWNRTCSIHGGLGNNKSVDLALEHLNREFKENVNDFHSHLTETSNLSKKTHGAAAPRTQITWASFLGSEEPSLKLLRSAKLQRTNFSPNSNCWHSKSAIFLSSNIKLQYKFIVAVMRRNTYYIYIYIYLSSVTYWKSK